MIRSCNIANLVIGSNVLDKKINFAFLTVAISTSFDTTKCYHIFRQPKVVQKWVGLGGVHSFMLSLGQVGLGHFTCQSGMVGSKKFDPHPTLV